MRNRCEIKEMRFSELSIFELLGEGSSFLCQCSLVRHCYYLKCGSRRFKFYWLQFFCFLMQEIICYSCFFYYRIFITEFILEFL